jgi:mRNA interferase MazF
VSRTQGEPGPCEAHICPEPECRRVNRDVTRRLHEGRDTLALLIANAGRGDWIACQITSNPYADPRAVEIIESDFVSGTLQRVSYARPGKLFTASEGLFSSVPATVIPSKLHDVRGAVVALINDGAA